MSKENSAGETIGATTTIILEPARISGSTVEPSRREITRKRRKERRLSCALVLFIAAVAGYVNRSVDVELNGQKTAVRVRSEERRVGKEC